MLFRSKSIADAKKDGEFDNLLDSDWFDNELIDELIDLFPDEDYDSASKEVKDYISKATGQSQINENSLTSKYINRGRLNQNAISKYLKSVIDSEYLDSVDTFMNDDEGWGESSSYFFEGDETPWDKLMQAVGDYKELGQNNSNPLWKALNDATFTIINSRDKLKPKGKVIVEKILSDFGVLKQYQQYVDDLEKPKTDPTDEEV